MSEATRGKPSVAFIGAGKMGVPMIEHLPRAGYGVVAIDPLASNLAIASATGARVVGDALWAELYRHFPQPRIVELGFFIGLTMGQQRWNRLLNIEHNKFMAGDSGGRAPALSQGTA